MPSRLVSKTKKERMKENTADKQEWKGVFQIGGHISLQLYIADAIDTQTGLQYAAHGHKIRGCIQKFQDWPPGATTAHGTALCQ
jgi:hypothetical protein